MPKLSTQRPRLTLSTDWSAQWVFFSSQKLSKPYTIKIPLNTRVRSGFLYLSCSRMFLFTLDQPLINPRVGQAQSWRAQRVKIRLKPRVLPPHIGFHAK
jgi:hypothetical protein